MRIGSGTAAVIALALIAVGDVHGAGLGSDQVGKPTWPWRLTQQAEPSTPPAQPAAPSEQPAQEKAQEKAQENRPSGAPSPPAANAPPAAPPAGTPAVVLDDQEVSGIVGKSVRSSADEDMGRIVDVIVSQDGHIRAAIIDFGGFLGIGTRKIAADWNALDFAPLGKPGAIIDLNCEPGRMRGTMGAGVVHHIAFRAASDQDQLALRETLRANGSDVTPVIDRQYFHSIYFREPSGVLFEIATVGPGFATDEPLEHLGERLSLPPSYEHLRAQLEPILTPLPDPRAVRAQ